MLLMQVCILHVRLNAVHGSFNVKFGSLVNPYLDFIAVCTLARSGIMIFALFFVYALQVVGVFVVEGSVAFCTISDVAAPLVSNCL